MDVIDAIGLLKDYRLYDDAQNECRRKKIDNAPYDMKGHHEVYIFYLSKKLGELNKNKSSLVKVKCSELDNITDDPAPIHDNCFFVGVNCTKDYCKTHCKYYNENLKQIDEEMKKIHEAIQVLKNAAEKDEDLK